MSNIKITQLPVITSVTGSEVVPIVKDGGTVQITLADFVAWVNLAGLGLRQIQVGAPDSAGTGFRTLRISN